MTSLAKVEAMEERDVMKMDMEGKDVMIVEERDIRRVHMAGEMMEEDVNKEATMEERTNTLAVQLNREDTTTTVEEEAMEVGMMMI